MRDAALPSRSPPRRSRSGKLEAPARRSLFRPLFPAVVRDHPLKALATGSFAIVLVGIIANATVFQRSRHPAPLFSGPERVASVQLPAVPVPPSRPPDAIASAAALPIPDAPRETPSASPQPGGHATPARKPEPPPTARSSDHAAAPARKDDGIARLIRGNDADGAPPSSADAGEPSVLAAQRALATLGYPVKADGKMGETTRQALAAFQRDRHLSLGEGLTPKLLRKLAAAAGAHPG